MPFVQAGIFPYLILPIIEMYHACFIRLSTENIAGWKHFYSHIIINQIYQGLIFCSVSFHSLTWNWRWWVLQSTADIYCWHFSRVGVFHVKLRFHTTAVVWKLGSRRTILFKMWLFCFQVSHWKAWWQWRSLQQCTSACPSQCCYTATVHSQPPLWPWPTSWIPPTWPWMMYMNIWLVGRTNY